MKYAHVCVTCANEEGVLIDYETKAICICSEHDAKRQRKIKTYRKTEKSN